MELITENVAFSKEAYDYFLLAPNIERRSREAFLRLSEQKIIQKTIILDYENFHKTTTPEQEASFYKDFETESIIVIRKDNDKDTSRELAKTGIQEEDRIALDITGFSIPNIYYIMNIIKDIFKVRHLDVFYTEPKFYIYEEGYFDAYHKKKERNRKSDPATGLHGYCNSGASEKEVLVIFLGFDGGLAGQVYFDLAENGRHEILQILAVNGFPSYTAKLKDISLFNNEDFINKIGHENVRYAVANNPFDVYNLLCEILCEVLKDYSETQLNLCTIGSKPMALGTCLFALEHLDNVKVTYPFYEKTQFDIDEEPGKIWKYSIDFR